MTASISGCAGWVLVIGRCRSDITMEMDDIEVNIPNHEKSGEVFRRNDLLKSLYENYLQ